ncbi:hypothetical protein C8F01DRAFT_1373827 [Mycena amicta]|nr:hypothetical protein C8F01DRAFT_1373827 [Mycena amicta]
MPLRFPPLELTMSLLVASLTAITIPGRSVRYAFLVIFVYWALKYSSRVTPGQRMRALQSALASTSDSLLRAQSICIFDQASLAYENTRLLRTEHRKVELEQDLRDLRRCSWIEYLPAAYHFVRKIARCIAEVRDIAHHIQHLVANEKKRKLVRAANDAKQDYATLSSSQIQRKAHYTEEDISLSARIRTHIPVYMKWKYEADKNLAARTGFTWTILRPGGLTNNPGTGTASIGRTRLSPTVSRDDVALALYLPLRARGPVDEDKSSTSRAQVDVCKTTRQR